MIDTATLIERLDATLTTVDRLEHFEGHLLNWYDTQTLAPLLPQYVSTVDSGNFAAALLTLATGLREIAAQDATDAAAQTARSSRRSPRGPRAYFDEMHFGFLYDRRRRLFAIGYRLADATARRAHGQRRSTTCWPRRRGWPASSPSPRATCPSCTGSISAA